MGVHALSAAACGVAAPVRARDARRDAIHGGRRACAPTAPSVRRAGAPAPLRALSDKEAERSSDKAEEESSGECPLGFGKNGAITNAVNGVKKSMYLSFMSSSQPLTMEEAAASAASAKPEDIVILDNKVFLKSLKRAIEDPVGMPAAILDGIRRFGTTPSASRIPSAPAACPRSTLAWWSTCARPTPRTTAIVSSPTSSASCSRIWA